MAIAMRAPRAAPEEVEAALAESIHGLMRGVLHELQPTLEREGLTMGRFWMLHLISTLDSPTLTRVSRHLAVSGPAACGALDGLEDAGLIARRRSEKDRRVVELVPTAHGRRAEAAVRRDIGRALGDAADGIRPEDLRTTAATLATISSRLGERP
ncbi:MAG TPA: MarR family transcriptional regulator [Thermoplasmata archaeon]|jgi:DNA-binding MarR family transcriptional regulator|nr:MarR family transcriptional regulator [Thermoplasmata archaeon]